MHPSTEAILRFFDFMHLPQHLKVVSVEFYVLAHALVEEHKLDGPELTIALRKLLEAKDAAVRSALPTP